MRETRYLPGPVPLVEPALLSVLVPLAPVFPAPPGVVPVAGALAAFSPDEVPEVVSPVGLPAPVLVPSLPLVPGASVVLASVPRERGRVLPRRPSGAPGARLSVFLQALPASSAAAKAIVNQLRSVIGVFSSG